MTRKSDIEEVYAATPMQHGLILQTLADPAVAPYHAQIAYRLHGSIDVTSFGRAWQNVVDRHAALRSAFAWEKLPCMVQVVFRKIDVTLFFEDLRRLNSHGQELRLEEYMREDRLGGFDFTQAPLMRIALFQTGESEHLFVWTCHHAIVDGWSSALVLKEAAAFYEAYATGKELELPLPPPYKDYAEWFSRRKLPAAEAYWRKLLAGVDSPTPLPQGSKTSNSAGSSRALVRFKLTEKLKGQLQNIAAGCHVTINTFFQGAWSLLLSRYSGQEDVVFGVTIAGRPAELPGVETMVGTFINTVPVRSCCSHSRRLDHWLLELQEEQVRASQFDYAHLTEIHEWTSIPPGVPIFESLLVYENFPRDVFDELYGRALPSRNPDQAIRAESAGFIAPGSYPLALDIRPADGFSVELSYDCARYEECDARSLLAVFQELLETMACDPRQQITEVMRISEEEQRWVVERGSGIKEEAGSGSVHELFEEEVEKRGEAVAVSWEGGELSYRELNERANQLGWYLRGLGVGPEVRVAVCLERGPEMVVGILGVLKAGGAYVPLAPSDPGERIAFALSDAQAAVVLTSKAVKESLPALWIQVVVLDEDWPEIARAEKSNPGVGVGAGNLAYVIYTSGSSGQPKGVMVTHGGLRNYIGWAVRNYEVRGGGASVLHTSLSFDMSVTSIWPALVSGEKVIVVKEGREGEGVVEELLREGGLGVVKATPAHLMMLSGVAGRGKRECREQARVLVIGGEALKYEQLRPWQGTGARLINEYGPTETVVGCVVYEAVEMGSGAVPIGRPIANTQVYVVDEGMRLVPAGVVGELYIGGVGVARGYVNRPELTAEKFVPDEWGGEGGGRLYRTGDVVRWRNDGNLEFLGRKDEQVKVRGYRIELGEIEAVLEKHPGVKQAVVVVREEEEQKHLVGYVVGAGEEKVPDSGELRRYLQGKLPEYMVPGRYVVLERMPLTANGKVDRKGLPAWGGGGGEEEGEKYEAPAGVVEEILAGIWGQVLKRERVGVRDNFFQLGGHSLLATQVVSRVGMTLGVEIPIRAVFEHAELRGLAREIERVREQGKAGVIPGIERAGRRERMPLSYAQQQLWFLWQLEPESTAYNIAMGVRLRGKLEEEGLRRAFAGLVQRHEVLRTVFPMEAGEAWQQVGEGSDVELRVVDVREVEEEERAGVVEEMARREAGKSFDLGRGPLLRVVLIREWEQEHVLVVSMHHIVSDGWSMAILVRELGALYEGYGSGGESGLEELGVQYGDYAVWQREWLSGAVLEEQLKYWRKQLEGVEGVELRGDRKRGEVGKRTAKQWKKRWGTELSEGVRRLSRREGVTVFMGLWGGFAAVLGRWTGQRDIAVGSDVANRNRGEIEGLIGFFVNQLVLRVKLEWGWSFRELLGRVRETTLEAYEHQDVPFERVVEALAPERDLRRAPLFQIKLVMQNQPQAELELSGGLRMEPYGLEGGEAKLDLTVVVQEGSGGELEWEVEYAGDIYEEETINGLMGSYERLMESAVREPERGIGELEWMGEEQRRRIVEEWNGTEAWYPRDRCVHELFEEEVEKRGEAVAVSWEGGELSYRELNERANQLGWYLRGLGVGPEVRVAVCLERGPEMVVGILGVLKAGGAYVPLDPEYPAERLAYMLEDSQSAVVISREALLQRLPAVWGHAVCVDGEAKQIASLSRANLGAATVPENLGYVIYTSGSTGQPKGVCLPQKGMSNLAQAQIKAFGVRAGAGVLQFASLSFDACTWEWLMALLAGARLVLCARGEAASGEKLTKLLAKERVEIATIPPSVLEQMPGSELPDLSTLVVAGEACPAAVVEQWGRGRKMLNAYGPTEVTVCATISQGLRAGEEPPIGVPIANTQVYVVDEGMRLVPAGVVGELYIGGVGVARGYVNRPELTAEKFVPDEWGGEGGGRLYRTGDVVRWRNDGNLEFLGRKDEQVKVRGYRIELGEIEAVLEKHPGVKQAVVVVREEEEQKHLVGYVVGAGEEKVPDSGELRRYLQGKLPEYMVPGRYVVLERMPLTANGKVDRKGLPAWGGGGGEEEGEKYEAPAGVVEEILAGIWGQVLKRERVGVRDNFFQLGGHSLLATQVVSRVGMTLGVEIPIRAVFEHAELRGLAREIERVREQGKAGVIPGIERAGRRERMPLSYAQQRLWFLWQLEPESTAYNIAMGVRLRGKLEEEGLRRAFAGLVQRHEVLRTVFPMEAGEAWQQVGEGSDVELRVVDVREVEEEERAGVVEEMARREAGKSFDLGRGPLLRVVLIREWEQEHVLVVSMHHIVSDGWSMAILVRELGALYEGYGSGGESGLEELGVQYGDYAVWQREWLSGAVLEEQLKYWRKQLEGVEGVELRGDRKRGEVGKRTAKQWKKRWGTELSEGVRRLSRREGVTVFMGLWGGFAAVLGRWTGQRDIAVGSDVANRNRGEIEGLIGFFVNQLVLRVKLEWGWSFRELLGRVRETTLEAYEHQDVPFERVVEALAPERDLRRAPLFQIKLVMQNQPQAELELSGGLRMEPYGLEGGEAKLDLTVVVQEGSGGELEWEVEYAGDIYEEETINGLMGSYERLMESAVREPERGIGELEWMGEEQRRRIAEEWNGTEAWYPRDRCVHELFEEEVEKRGEAVAVSWEGGELSYRELNERANQLGWYLRGLGVGPEVRVAVCLERGPEMVVGILGVLKAGGAYVPLAPSDPGERIAFALSDAQAAVVLTSKAVKESLPALWIQVVVLDEDWPEIARAEKSNPGVGVGAGNLAYVIYTSGSSGQPKGVMVTHGGLRNYIGWAVRNYEVRGGGASVLHTSLSFDMSVTSIWPALVSGEKVIVVKEGREGEGVVEELLREGGLGVVKATPAHLMMLSGVAGRGKRECREQARVLVIGGEALKYEQLRPWQGTGARLINEYGPTETVVGCVVYEAVEMGSGAVPIGRPIANTQVYVVDEGMRLVPAGVVGELYIGGVGVARGYVNRPELTAEKFVPDEWGGEGGGRLYRTGDVVRWRNDGNLEFLGRKDEQVKVRGYRIELGEIEAVLEKHPGVKQAVVVVREEEEQKHLVGYVVGAGEEKVPDSGELRRYLQGKLPEYMVPGRYVVLERMPLTANGKVDRKGLPAITPAPERDSEYVEPATVVERELASLWSALLKVERIGIHDNFFALGGHSLLGIRLLAHIESMFHVELSPSVIFKRPTIAELVEEISEAALQHVEADSAPLALTSRDSPRAGRSS